MGQNNLNLGCGYEYIDGWINVDLYTKSDIKRDLNKIPWKLGKDRYDEVKMINVMEHLDISFYDCMHQIYFLSKKNALVEIEVPYCHSQSANSPEHIHRGYNLNAFETLCLNIDQNSIFKGKIIRKDMIPSRFGKLIPRIPIHIGDCNNLRDIFAILFNEIYTHIHVWIKIEK